MRVVSRPTLIAAGKKYPDADASLRAWYHDANSADWTDPEAIRKRYPTASIVGDERVVFNIKGNKYRLVVAIKYSVKFVFIKFFGTHAEYDEVNVKEVKL